MAQCLGRKFKISASTTVGSQKILSLNSIFRLQSFSFGIKFFTHSSLEELHLTLSFPTVADLSAMSERRFSRSYSVIFVFILAVFIAGCSTTAKSKYFGKTEPPTANVLRYVSGSAPETLDPQLPDGQPEARIFLALFEGLVEYGPIDQQPIPAIARSWKINPNVDEFIFKLRDNAKWSDGTPITARDFVYSIRRGI